MLPLLFFHISTSRCCISSVLLVCDCLSLAVSVFQLCAVGAIEMKLAISCCKLQFWLHCALNAQLQCVAERQNRHFIAFVEIAWFPHNRRQSHRKLSQDCAHAKWPVPVMLELDDESKIIKELFVIKDICSWLPPELDGWKVFSQEHMSLFFNHK